VRILLADDQHLVRVGLKCFIHQRSRYRVIAETGDGLRVAALAQRLKPDVVLLDVHLPGLYGLEVTRRIRETMPTVGIVVLSRLASAPYVLGALRHGANGYVAKQASPRELLTAIRRSLKHTFYVSTPLSGVPLERWIKQAQSLGDDEYDSLTNREREVLQLVAEGHTSGEIGHRLGISPRTVETHRAAVLKKLGLKTQAELIHYAIARGIVSPPEPLPMSPRL
jgi:DNA-binding NarL/FixJ family response regulator